MADTRLCVHSLVSFTEASGVSFHLPLVYVSNLGIQSKQMCKDCVWICSAGRVLTQDSVERVPHIDSVELRCREGTAHRSVACEITREVRNSRFFFIFLSFENK